MTSLVQIGMVKQLDDILVLIYSILVTYTDVWYEYIEEKDKWIERKGTHTCYGDGK